MRYWGGFPATPPPGPSSLCLDERHQYWSVLQVLLVLGTGAPPPLSGGLQEGDARDARDEEHHHDGAGHRQVLPPPEDAAARDVDTEPEADLAEIVGVARDRPQSGLDELALVGGVALEDGLLHVGHQLQEEAEAPDRPAQVVPVGEGGVPAARVQGQGGDERDEDPQALDRPELEESRRVLLRLVKPPVTAVF